MEKASVCDQSLNWKQAFSSPSLGNQGGEQPGRANVDGHLGMECHGGGDVEGSHAWDLGDLGEREDWCEGLRMKQS